MIVLSIAVLSGSALALSLSQQKQYTATASLLFRDPRFDEKIFGSAVFQPSVDPEREAQTNVRLVQLDQVAERTARALGRPAAARGAVRRLSGSQVHRKVQVAAAGQSDVVTVKATDPSPAFAARLANAFAEQYIGFRRDADRAKVRAAQALVTTQLARLGPQQRGTPAADSLEQRAQQLGILSSLQTGNAELVQRAGVPSSPSSPHPRRNALVGGALGALLGFALSLLFDRLDRRLYDPEELEEAYALPLLSTIPDSRAYGSAFKNDRPLPTPEAEAFRMLRARLRYFNVDRDIRSVLVTSPGAADGKTTVAWHLAMAAAGVGPSKVLLIEADLRRPSLAEQHGLEPSPGLVELLTHHLDLSSVIQRVPVPQAGDAELPSITLDVLVAGGIPPNPAELVESHRLASVLDSLFVRYDLVVVDTPPMLLVADAIPLLRQVAGVIVVSRLGKSTRDGAKQLREQLDTLNAPTLGVVANGAKRSAENYYYAYGYARQEPKPAEGASSRRPAAEVGVGADDEEPR
ncbi:MAG: polysaccharide biosynthesis tyrosine autokinase [Actinomycetota bacterium]|nr:polysaccharide biosynthesis tyrosine autokinase [Actinomycetota bacterium]